MGIKYYRKYVARAMEEPFGMATWGVYRVGEGDGPGGVLIASVISHRDKGIDAEPIAKRFALLLEEGGG